VPPWAHRVKQPARRSGKLNQSRPPEIPTFRDG
jgi:hypothetical protein